MRFFTKLQRFAVFLAVLISVSARVGAQGFGLSISNSPNPVTVSNVLAYTISVTNQTGLLLTNFVVTNTLSGPLQWVSGGSSYGTNYFILTNATGITFGFRQFTNGDVARMFFGVRPLALGFFTNSVLAVSSQTTNTVATNSVTQVITVQANLGVTLAGPVTAVIVGDPLTYGVTVTNSGPSTAPNVVLTNALPPGVVFIGVSPTSQTYTIASSNVIFNLGPLANGSSQHFQLTVQPTNAGVLTFSTFVVAPGLVETNTANNNSASTNLTVINYLAGDLVVVTNSAQNVNPQNGLIEQSILVSNVGTNEVPAVRVVVTGLTNRLFNASGSNSGSPFVTYVSSLATNASVTLLLQYAPRKIFPFTNSQLHAYAVPLPDLTPPVATALGTNIAYTRIVMLTNGNPLIEFPSVLGRTYTMVYSDNLLFSNAMIAPPAIVAPANMVHWIDYGPPTTGSAPGSGSRYYRVFLNP